MINTYNRQLVYNLKSFNQFFLKTNFFNYYILGCGHFLYFEASNRETGSALSAPFTSTSGEMCLCFSLSMYSLDPKTMGSLSLSLMKGNTFVKSFWDISGSVTANQTSWDKIHLNLPALNANSDYKVSWRFLTVWFFLIILTETYCEGSWL